MYSRRRPCAAPTSTSTSGRMACSPPWRGARPPLACAVTAAAGCWSWRATRPRRSIRATTTRRRRTGFDRIVVAPSTPLGIEWLPEAEDAAGRLPPRRAGAGRAVRAVGEPRPARPQPSPRRDPPRRGRRRSLPARGRARRARGHREPRAGAGDAGARAGAAVRPSRPGRRLAGLVSRADRLRRRDVARLARVGAVGEARAPALGVVFAMLAGLAPLHAERLAARGGPARGRPRPR